ncbi:MAG TPA: D-2-hydroxyacid dehydrogenase [Vicinamibacterales bacterium]|nr:D-2-hydroxyacid dehydrogenase [Vicinamibacterales bacterium]
MKILISIQQPVKQWQIPPEGVETLRQKFPLIKFIHATTTEQRAEGLTECDAAYTWILNSAELATAPKLKWVHTSAVAVETLCLPELFARGIAVSNTRGVQAIPIAEHVLTVALALAKQIPFVLDNQRQARWAQNEFMGERLPWLLHGRTLGLVGVGTIGSEIAKRAEAFGMRVIALRRRPAYGVIGHVERVYGKDQLDEFLGQCHVVVVAAPLTPETHGLLGAAQFAQLPRGAVVINVGRAKIIDTGALIESLHAGHLGGASLDVFPQEPLPADHPLWKTPNVILTPHTSGFRQGHWDEVVELYAENIQRWLKGEPLKYRIEPELGY